MAGMGSMGNACGISPEQILTHYDIVMNLRRYEQGIQVNQQTLGLQSIQEVGIQGNYLTDKLTLQYLKSEEQFLSEFCEVYYPGGDQKTMLEKIHHRAEEIMATHHSQVNEDRLGMVNAYVNMKIKKIMG